ncbi:MAG: hypothetical protein U0Q16_01915 [Bryobacteraceae bacterium]
MWIALALAIAAADLIPARWSSSDSQSLDLVKQTPINCLLLEPSRWSKPFSEAAEKSGIATFGLIHATDDTKELATRAKAAGLSGIVLEGKFDPSPAPALRDSGLLVVEMGPRARIQFDSASPILATNQGVWPGINTVEDKTKAAPSGGPWIDTNAGFLRFFRVSTKAQVWMGYVPPANQVIPAARYLQAIADAAIVGAKWVLALDPGFEKRLLARDVATLKDWKKIGDTLAFYWVEHKDWQPMEIYGKLALVQDVNSGGLISGGILDMITVKHTPVRPVTPPKLSDAEMKLAKMAVNVDPARLTPEQKEILRTFTRGGGTLLNAPPGWKFPPAQDDKITLGEEEIKVIDQIWKEVNSMTGRHNLGARLFNVSSVLSNMVTPATGKPLVLHLVNYSDYPVENVAVHLLGKFAKAKIHEPGSAGRDLAIYEHEDGSGVDLEKLSSIATLVIE